MDVSLFRSGVSSHQQLGDEPTVRFVIKQMCELLSSYQQQYQLVAYSSLALGADQVFVWVALELGISVEVVLPCAEYAAVFPTDFAQQEYQRLLRACSGVHTLPMRECTEDAYLAAGEWVVDHSDLVALVWNGLLAKGRGGTGDVAAYARSTHRPFVHLIQSTIA